jgi:hypothetical protein
MVPISGLPCFLARWVVVRVSRQWNWRRRVVGLRWGREARGREKALNLQWSTWSGEAGGERAVGTLFFLKGRTVGTWDGKEPLGLGTRRPATLSCPFGHHLRPPLPAPSGPPPTVSMTHASRPPRAPRPPRAQAATPRAPRSPRRARPGDCPGRALQGVFRRLFVLLRNS